MYSPRKQRRGGAMMMQENTPLLRIVLVCLACVSLTINLVFVMHYLSNATSTASTASTDAIILLPDASAPLTPTETMIVQPPPSDDDERNPFVDPAANATEIHAWLLQKEKTVTASPSSIKQVASTPSPSTAAATMTTAPRSSSLEHKTASASTTNATTADVVHYTIPLDKLLGNPACKMCGGDFSPVSFLHPPQPNFTFLASFPGSGNNWIISQLTTGSRLHHCSVYDHNGTYPSNFDFHACIVTKTHFPFYKTEYDRMYAKQQIVYLMRSPFDAILAELFRRQVPANRVGRYFGHFARKWRDHVRHYLGKRYWTNARRFHREDTGGTVRFLSGNKLVVFYEDFRAHQIQSLRNMFTFIHPSFGGRLPAVEDSITCALETDMFLLGRQTSRGRKKQHLFAMEENVELTRLGCKLWAGLWFEEMWGPCMDEHGRYYSRDVLGYANNATTTTTAADSLEDYKPVCFEPIA